MSKIAPVVGALVTLAGLVIALIALFQQIGAQQSDNQYQQQHLTYQEIQLTEVHREVELQAALLSVQSAILELQSRTPQAVPQATEIAQEIAALQENRAAIVAELDSLGGAAAPANTPVPPTATAARRAPTPTVALSYGPNQMDAPPSHGGRDGDTDSSMGASSGAAQPTPRPNKNVSYVGNLITCVPPNPPNYAWIWIYRLNDRNEWVRIGKGIGSIQPSGYLKVDGLAVDVTRFGTRGEPYKIEQVIDGQVANSAGDFLKGEPEFRIYPSRDNKTPWGCP